MTASYHVHTSFALARAKWARGFAILGFVLSLSGCSVSMPMSGLVDAPPSTAVADKAANDVTAGSAAEKPGFEVAAAQPEL